MVKVTLALILALFLLVLISALLLGRQRLLEFVWGPIVGQEIDFETLSRPATPNHFLACPARLCSETADLVSPVFDVGISELKTRFQAMALQQPRVEEVGPQSESQLNFVQRSWLFGFPDTVTVRFIALPEDRSTLAIYSRSHYGYSDLGTNRRRVRNWLARLQEQLPTS